MKKLLIICLLNLAFVTFCILNVQATGLCANDPDCQCAGWPPGTYIGASCKMESLPGACAGGGWAMFSQCVPDSVMNMCNCNNEGNDCDS
jgi:hypothetical protein